MSRITIGLAAAGAIATILLWWQYEATAEDLAHAEQRVQAHESAAERTREAMDQLQAERQRAQDAVAEARRRRTEIQREAKELRTEIDQLQETDDEVDDWSRRPLPGALTDRLQQLPGGGDADGDAAGDAAGGADGADTGADSSG